MSKVVRGKCNPRRETIRDVKEFGSRSGRSYKSVHQQLKSWDGDGVKVLVLETGDTDGTILFDALSLSVLGRYGTMVLDLLLL